MEKGELRRIGTYTERLAAGSMMTYEQRLEMRELLEKWLAEEEEGLTKMRIPSSWGDVRRLY